ncbi:RTA-like protein [Lipomyces tetrasporus]|uniref:Sphingoid long-chain base transporter RSB1 n=1 Tax=Lipomyces tetrasporus TaxID=54092 RepID=A0AAD7QQI8_9ASCO|nr:RTA-like protein [Lipomyces tetrasporus]KAJ8099420.1 RTA-like protein [Lipomyces tetrasporus]
MFIANGLETGGYIARYLSSKDPYIWSRYTAQSVALIFAPAFFMAAIYYLLGEITVIWGIRHSRFKPWAYTKIFVSLDVICIWIQAAGGGAAAGASNTDGGNPQIDIGIMIGGLGFQVAATILFMLFCLDYYIRVQKNHRLDGSDPSFAPNWELNNIESDEQGSTILGDAPAKFAHIRNAKKTKVFLFAVAVAVILVFVRSVYRVVEMAYGWDGYLMIEEGYFLVLDALMVALASWITFIFHPRIFLGKINISAEQKEALGTRESNGSNREKKKRFIIF